MASLNAHTRVIYVFLRVYNDVFDRMYRLYIIINFVILLGNIKQRLFNH